MNHSFLAASAHLPLNLNTPLALPAANFPRALPGLFHLPPEVGIEALPQAPRSSAGAQAVVDSVGGGSGSVQVQRQRHEASSFCHTGDAGVRHAGEAPRCDTSGESRRLCHILPPPSGELCTPPDFGTPAHPQRGVTPVPDGSVGTDGRIIRRLDSKTLIAPACVETTRQRNLAQLQIFQALELAQLGRDRAVNTELFQGSHPPIRLCLQATAVVVVLDPIGVVLLRLLLPAGGAAK